MTGTIKAVTDRGFGFIRPDERTESDVFFHASALLDTDIDLLSVGDRVTYAVGEDPRSGRLRALQVRCLDSFDVA